MATQIIRPSNREEWLQHRQQGIGSSEVATILGLNPWETPYQLWRRKIGLDEPKDETFAMRAGHYLEDAVSLFWHDETGREIIRRSAGDWLIRSNEHPFMQVSPDRTYWLSGMTRNDRNKGILECKTTQMKIDPEDLPKHWFCQVQYQLGVAEYTEGSLAWLCSGREFGYKDINFVPDFFQWMQEEVEKFWTDNIIGKTEPEAQDVADVLIKFSRHTDGKIIEISDDIYTACNDLKEIKQQIAVLDEQKNELEAKIKVGFGDAEAISYGGQTIATWKAPKPSDKFDSKAFCKAHPDLAKEFTMPYQGARRFLLKV
jgi:putative phage-type endonuclease